MHARLNEVAFRIGRYYLPDCLWSGDPALKEIALTFDDGPHLHYTSQLLDVLNHYSVKASFFVLGQQAELHPQSIRKIWQQGHWLGLHGYQHISFIGLQNLATQLHRTQCALAKATEQPKDLFRDVRPPYGMLTPALAERLVTWNYRPVLWHIVPGDYARPGIDVIVQRVLDLVRNGALIVLHDGVGSSETVGAVAALVPQLLRMGYRFSTVERFWQQKGH